MNEEKKELWPCELCLHEDNPVDKDPCNSCNIKGYFANYEEKKNLTSNDEKTEPKEMAEEKTELELTKIALDAACKRIGQLEDELRSMEKTRNRQCEIIEEKRAEIEQLKAGAK